MRVAGGFLIRESVIYLEMGNKTERNKATNSSAKNPATQTQNHEGWKRSLRSSRATISPSPPCPLTPSLSATSTLILTASMDGDSTTSLGSCAMGHYRPWGPPGGAHLGPKQAQEPKSQQIVGAEGKTRRCAKRCPPPAAAPKQWAQGYQGYHSARGAPPKNPTECHHTSHFCTENRNEEGRKLWPLLREGASNPRGHGKEHHDCQHPGTRSTAKTHGPAGRGCSAPSLPRAGGKARHEEQQQLEDEVFLWKQSGSNNRAAVCVWKGGGGAGGQRGTRWIFIPSSSLCYQYPGISIVQNGCLDGCQQQQQNQSICWHSL